MKWKNIENKYSSHLEKLRNLSPYELFELDSQVSKTELKRRYLEKVKTYHPDKADKFMEDYCQEVMKIINSAYEFLSKKNK